MSYDAKQLDEKLEKFFFIISSEVQATTNQRRPLANHGLLSLVPSAVANTVMMNEDKMTTVNHFHGCQATIIKLSTWSIACVLGAESPVSPAEAVVDDHFTWIDD